MALRSVRRGTSTAIFVSFLGLLGCGGTTPILVPYVPRVPVLVTPLTSLVVDYERISQPFEVLASVAISTDLLDIHEPSFPEKFVVRTYQNPLRPISKNMKEKPQLVVKGEVERIAYEPVSNVKRLITAYAVWGLIGLAGTDASSGSMGAYVQYRFTVLDSAGATIDSFVVIGTSAGNPNKVSRRALIAEANIMAAGDFATQLLQHSLNVLGIEVQFERVKYYSKEVKRDRWLDFMIARLKEVQ